MANAKSQIIFDNDFSADVSVTGVLKTIFIGCGKIWINASKSFKNINFSAFIADYFHGIIFPKDLGFIQITQWSLNFKCKCTQWRFNASSEAFPVTRGGCTRNRKRLHDLYVTQKVCLHSTSVSSFTGEKLFKVVFVGLLGGSVS